MSKEGIKRRVYREDPGRTISSLVRVLWTGMGAEISIRQG